MGQDHVGVRTWRAVGQLVISGEWSTSGTQFAVASTLKSPPAPSQTNTDAKLSHLHFREVDFLALYPHFFLFVAIFIQNLIHKCCELHKSNIKISVDA